MENNLTGAAARHMTEKCATNEMMRVERCVYHKRNGECHCSLTHTNTRQRVNHHRVKNGVNETFIPHVAHSSPTATPPLICHVQPPHPSLNVVQLTFTFSNFLANTPSTPSQHQFIHITLPHFILSASRSQTHHS